MSMEWETTSEDLEQVLEAHGLHLDRERLDEVHDNLDHDAIEDGVFHYITIEDQTASMLSDIENQLTKNGTQPPGTSKNRIIQSWLRQPKPCGRGTAKWKKD